MKSPEMHILPHNIRSLFESPTQAPKAVYSPYALEAGHDAPPPPDFTLFDAVNISEADALYSTVRTLKPSATAEVGFCCGGSGIAIMQALADNGQQALHYACDPFQSSYARNAGIRNVEIAGLTHLLSFHEAYLEEMYSALPRIQFGFIDASHLFDLTILDFILLDKKLDTGGILAFHDLWMPSMQKLIRFILKNRNYTLSENSGEHSPSKASLLQRSLARALRKVPSARRIFSSRILDPWQEYGVGNIAFLVKTDNDERDWRDFTDF